MDKCKEFLSNLVINTKYARYLPELKRREVWEEIVARNEQMHHDQFDWMYIKHSYSDTRMFERMIKKAYKHVYNRTIMPSMRSLQFSGKPILEANHRIYNCAWRIINEPIAFHEIFYLLLLGVGVGYSVQQHHVYQLPTIKQPTTTIHHTINDSIEGWATAVNILIEGYYSNYRTQFDYSKIRAKGTPLVSTGGFAPGPDAFRNSLTHIARIFDNAIGRKLATLEVHDVICHLSDAVLSGGIRRAALLSIFSYGDQAMMECKAGNFYETNPQRARANNSVYLPRETTTKQQFANLFKQTCINGTGEPGFIFTNDTLEYGFNPCCVQKDCLITTSEGLRRVHQLENKPFVAIVNGKEYPSKGFWCTGTKEIYEVKTNRGFSVKATDDHRILTTDGWIELKDLVIGDTLILDKSIHTAPHNQDEFELGWLLGEVWGDGGHNPDKYKSYVRFWGENNKEMCDKASNIIEKLPLDYHAPIKPNNKPCYNHTHKTYQISNKKISLFVEKYLESKTKDIKDALLNESKSFIAGFISGAFDSDGCICGDTKGGGIQLQLAQVKEEDLLKIQIMLSLFGIISSIRKMVCKKESMLPDGNGGSKLYKTKQQYRLDIGRDSVELFANIIGFSEPHKAQKLKSLIESKTKRSYKTRYEASVISITKLGEEPVYDCTVPEADSFVCNGVIVHNCEISLKNKGVCNLVTIDAHKLSQEAHKLKGKDQNEYIQSVIASAALIGTMQATYTKTPFLDKSWQQVAEDEALLGVSFTGIQDNTGIESHVIGNIEHEGYWDLETLSKYVNHINDHAANCLFDINPAKRTTCIKPEGSTSIVCGTSSGLHLPYSEYYMRRVRVNNNMGINEAMFTHNPDFIEKDVYNPNYDNVISVPIHNESVPQHESDLIRMKAEFNEIKRFKDWIDGGHNEGSNKHNVSYTLKYNRETLTESQTNELIDLLYENRYYYSGITIFPEDGGGNYQQMPFEPIDKETYEKLASKFNAIDFTGINEINVDNAHLLQANACEGGRCEIN